MKITGSKRSARRLLSLAVLLVFIQAVFADDHRLRSSSIAITGDEAFTEPIEKIQVACSESGIVEHFNVRRGDQVDAGQLLLELNTAVLESSRQLALAKTNSTAKRNAANVELEQKKIRYQKLVQLYQDQAGSAEEVEKAKSEMLIAQENVAGIQDELEQYRLEVKKIESQMERRRVRSPISGVVIDVRKKPGEFVSLNDPHVATIVRLETLQVVFHLPTREAKSFQQGDQIRILMIESNQTAIGVVDYVAPITSADSGRVRMDVLIENDQGTYRSGVRCRMLEMVAAAAERQSPLIREPSKR